MCTLLRSLTVLLTTATLSACLPAERLCPAFYEPPTIAWVTVDAIGSAATYSNSAVDGMGTLTLQSRTDSEAYTDNPQSPENMPCFMDSERRYSIDNSDASLLVVFRQNETPSHPIESEQAISLGLFLQEPTGNLLYGFQFSVGDIIDFGSGAVHLDSQGLETSYFAERQIGQHTYLSVVEERYTDTLFVEERAQSQASAIVRVVVAKNAGLVEFERLDGTVFTRSDIQGPRQPP